MTPDHARPRIAFMFGTRDWYHRMTLSLKSLMKHTRLDRVYLMIEDDEFPEPLPPNVTCVNVSNQQYFPEDGPNYQSMYSYMVLLRAALPDMFPDIDIALCIDADTITRGDLGPVFDTDMTGFYLAAVKELHYIHRTDYYNAGVMLMNLAKMRRDDVWTQAVAMLNDRYFRWKEQDVLNDLCRRRIYSLPAKYNFSPSVTGYNCDDIVVRHYIGAVEAKANMLKEAAQYENLPWEDIIRTQEEGVNNE